MNDSQKKHLNPHRDVFSQRIIFSIPYKNDFDKDRIVKRYERKGFYVEINKKGRYVYCEKDYRHKKSCQDCKYRVVGCHAYCETYREYKKHLEELNLKRKENNFVIPKKDGRQNRKIK